MCTRFIIRAQNISFPENGKMGNGRKTGGKTGGEKRGNWEEIGGELGEKGSKMGEIENAGGNKRKKGGK